MSQFPTTGKTPPVCFVGLGKFQFDSRIVLAH